MRRVRSPLIFTGVHGRLGDKVLRQTKHGTVIAKRPSKPQREPPASQKSVRDWFRKGSEYAKAADCGMEGVGGRR